MRTLREFASNKIDTAVESTVSLSRHPSWIPTHSGPGVDSEKVLLQGIKRSFHSYVCRHLHWNEETERIVGDPGVSHGHK